MAARDVVGGCWAVAKESLGAHVDQRLVALHVNLASSTAPPPPNCTPPGCGNVHQVQPKRT